MSSARPRLSILSLPRSKSAILSVPPARGHVEEVRADPAAQRVAAVPACQDVLALAAEQQVVALLVAPELVVLLAPEQRGSVARRVALALQAPGGAATPAA